MFTSLKKSARRYLGLEEKQSRPGDERPVKPTTTKAYLIANESVIFPEEEIEKMTEEEKDATLYLGMESLKVPNLLTDRTGSIISTVSAIPTISDFQVEMDNIRDNKTVYPFFNQVLSILCDLLEPSLTSRISKRTFRSQEAIVKEKYRQKVTNPYIIHPFSSFRWYWDLIMVVTLFTTIIFLPLEIAFYSDSTYKTHWKVVNILVDLVFMVDIFFNFRTGYLHPATEEVILTNKRIFKNYLLTWFAIDFVSSVPFDYLYVAAANEESKNADVFITLRVLRFVKMLSLLRVLRLARLWRYIHKFEEILDIDSKVIGAFNLVLMMLLYSHWNGCVQYLVAFVEDFPEDSWAANLHLNATGVTTLDRYTNSVFRAMSHMMSIGYGVEPPHSLTDLWMAILSMVLGGTFYALFIGHLSRIVLTMDSSGRRYEEMLSEVREYLRFRRMPVQLQERVLEYYDHKYQRKFFDEARILNEPSMSDPLRQNDPHSQNPQGFTFKTFGGKRRCLIVPNGAKLVMMMHNCHNLVEKVPFLSSAPPDFLYDIICKLTFQVFFPGDVIINAGKRGDCMFFIEHGKVEIRLQTGQVVNVLGDGTHFGEISLLLEERRVASVVAVEMCDMYRLTKYNFEEVLLDYPGMKKVLERIARERLSETRKNDTSNPEMNQRVKNSGADTVEPSYSCEMPVKVCNLNEYSPASGSTEESPEKQQQRQPATLSEDSPDLPDVN